MAQQKSSRHSVPGITHMMISELCKDAAMIDAAPNNAEQKVRTDTTNP